MWKVLTGIRVLDLSRVFAGPAATQILGDLGADVIKVEEPGRGDEARHFGITPATRDRHREASPSFLALNRNKRSIAIDLSAKAGQRAVRRMAKGCDVVVHNFRPGAMQKFGLAYEELKTVRPDIIYCEFYSYGPQGPLSHIGANDLALQAHSGMMSITGEPDRPPVRCGTSVVDLHASLALVTAVLAALFHRERTGEGQALETSLLRSSAHLMNYFYGEYWALGVVRGRMGTANHLSVPNQVFPAADGSVVIIAPSDEMWKRTANALDPALDRPEWRTTVDRQQHRDAIIEAISAVTRTLASDDLVQRLGNAKVNVAKVQTIGEAADHPQLAAIGGVLELPLPSGETMKAAASPFALRGAPTAPDRAPPRLAADKDAILADLGFATDEVAALERDGAFGRGSTGAAS
jgi:crotonobetainyl-CoA:carnitine CoA-transferase CaiB-like acyl-CoA transferase